MGGIPRGQTQTAKDEVRSSCPGCWTPDRKAHWRCWIRARRAYAWKGCWAQSCSLRPWLRWFDLELSMGGLGTSNSRNDIRVVRRQALAVAALGRQDLGWEMNFKVELSFLGSQHFDRPTWMGIECKPSESYWSPSVDLVDSYELRAQAQPQDWLFMACIPGDDFINGDSLPYPSGSLNHLEYPTSRCNYVLTVLPVDTAISNVHQSTVKCHPNQTCDSCTMTSFDKELSHVRSSSIIACKIAYTSMRDCVGPLGN
jgi:hypothetical protein